MTPLQRLMALFEGNDTHYGTHGEPSRDPTGQSLKWVIRPTAKTLKGNAADEKLWQAHVDGKKPLGIVPIRTDSTTIWGSIDHDVYGEDLTELIKKVEALKLPLVPGRSKSGGLHLFCFAVEPVPAERMASLLRDLSAALGIAGSEIFPKQTAINVERGEQGSWMIMPYFGGTFKGKLERQVGLRNNGSEIGLQEFVRLAEKARLSPAQMAELAARNLRPKAATSKRGGGGKKGSKDMGADVPFGDGPPCLVHMIAAGGIKQGGQNNALFHMGVYFKKKNPEGWTQDLEQAAALYMTPAHPKSGVDTVIKSLKKKDYQYKCKDEPMLSHCDSVTCRKRTHGVSGGGGGGGPVPSITAIKKLDSDPPVWFVEVEGVHVECLTEDLQDWRRFQRLLMNRLHNPFGVIPQGEWLAVVGAAMSGMTPDDIIPVSPDASRYGEFVELAENYLTNRQAAVKEEDLLLGRPFEDRDQGRFYFNLGRLARYIDKEGMKGLSKPQIVAFLRQLNGGGEAEISEKRVIKGKTINLHFIPSDKVQYTPSVSSPPLRERPI